VGLLVVAPATGLASSRALTLLSELLLALAAVAFLVALSLYQPLAAMLLWLLLAPYSRHSALDISLGAGVPDLSLTRLMAGWLLVLLIAQAARGQRRLGRLTAADLAYVLFAAGMFISAPSSRWSATVAFQAVFDAYVVPFIALYLARQLVRELRDLRWVALTLLAMGMGFAFLVIREQITGEVLFYAKQSLAYSASFRKVISLMGNAAPMGVSTALTLPLAVMLLIQTIQAPARSVVGKQVTVSALAAAIAFVAVGVFMTYNRASWLGMALTLLVFIVLRPGGRRVFAPVLLVLALLAALSWQTVVNSPAVTERLLEDRSVDYRTTALDLGLDMVRRQPVFGVGYTNFGFVAAESYGWDPAPRLDTVGAAHNSYLFILVSAGLLAFLPYVAWIVLLARAGVQRWRRLSRSRNRAAAAGYLDALAAGAALFLTYFLASGTFDNAQTYIMNLIFYVGIGAVWGVTERGAVDE
jgi:O-antigen ligase